MICGGEKITAVLVGGQMDERHFGDLQDALVLYPKDATIVALTNDPQRPLSRGEPGRGIPFISSEASYDRFRAFVPAAMQSHGFHGIFHFIQFGHGAQGANLILQDDLITPRQFVDLFNNNLVCDGPSGGCSWRLSTAVILGGCYSGGVARQFLQSRFQPDFFFGASPPFTVGWAGLGTFFSKDARDLNGDGVVTLRERAVHEMNQGHNPLAIMFQHRGSKDVDMAGTRAAKPYFPKQVDTVNNHIDLLKAIDSLRFGEQAAILIPGGKGVPDKLRAWFEREAREGDGFYRFIIVKDNPESREFFSTKNGAGLFVVVPNLPRGGTALKPFEPIGDQVPKALANANPLTVIRGSWTKLKSLPNVDQHMIDGYEKYLIENPQFSTRDLVIKASTLLAGDEKKQIEGLQLVDLVLQVNNIDRSKLENILHKHVVRILDGRYNVSETTHALWINVLGRFGTPKAIQDLKALVIFCQKRFGDAFVANFRNQPAWAKVAKALPEAAARVKEAEAKKQAEEAKAREAENRRKKDAEERRKAEEKEEMLRKEAEWQRKIDEDWRKEQERVGRQEAQKKRFNPTRRLFSAGPLLSWRRNYLLTEKGYADTKHSFDAGITTRGDIFNLMWKTEAEGDDAVIGLTFTGGFDTTFHNSRNWLTLYPHSGISFGVRWRDRDYADGKIFYYNYGGRLNVEYAVKYEPVTAAKTAVHGIKATLDVFYKHILFGIHIFYFPSLPAASREETNFGGSAQWVF